MKTTDYEKQVKDFLEQTKTEFTVKFVKYDKYFPDDEQSRDIYEITLKKDGREYTFTFGQSLNSSGQYWLYGDYRRGVSEKPKFPRGEWTKNKNYRIPSAYDVLACIEKYDPGTFEDFCSEFGYGTDSRKAEKTYEAVKEQYLNICRLYSELEMQLLQEIQ